MQLSLVKLSVAAILLLAACVPPNSHGPALPDLSLSGFQTFPTPRTFDGPGTVFRITHAGTRFPVTRLSLTVEQAGKESFGTYTKKVEWKVGAVLKFLGAPKLKLTSQVSPDFDSILEISLHIGQGERERTYDDEVQAALKAAAIEFRPDSRYYVVRETIGVSELAYHFTRKRDLTSPLTTALRQVVEASVNLKWSNSEQTDLVQSFTPPHRVFYTAEEIVPPTGLVSATPQLRRVTEVLEWVTEEQ